MSAVEEKTTLEVKCIEELFLSIILKLVTALLRGLNNANT